MLTEKYTEYAEEYADNWKRFDSFMWSPPDDGVWAIYNTHTRDSSLIEESNHDTILKIFEKELEESPDIHVERHSHWAVGWVEGLVIRVYSDGEVTEVFKKLCDILEQLEEYPLLDEEDHSKKESEAALENIAFECGYAKGHEEEVYGYLSEHNQSAVENTDGRGAYPDRKEILDALDNLDLLSLQDRIDLDMVFDPTILVEDWNEAECYKYLAENNLEYDFPGYRQQDLIKQIVEHMLEKDDWEGHP